MKGKLAAVQLPCFYGWIVVSVAFVTLSIGANVRTAFSLLFPPILSEFGWDRGTTATVFSIGFISATLYASILGHWMDRFGPRYVMPVAAVLVSSGLVLTTMSHQPWQFFVALGVLVVGTSSVLGYNGHFTFLPNWFMRQRGLAIGLALSGVGTGSIVMLPWLQATIDRASWRHGCWVLAGIILAVLAPLNFVFQRQRPEDLGLNPDGDPASHDDQETGEPTDNVVDHSWVAVDWTLPRALKTARFWWLALGFFCTMFIWYTIIVHQTQYLLDAGLDAAYAALVLGSVSLLGVGGQIGLGQLSDRIGREWVWTLSSFGFAASYTLLLVIETHPSLGLMALLVTLQGFVGYGLAAVYSAVPADIFHGKHYGVIFGTLTVAGALGGATGPWLAGVLYDLMGSYTLPFSIAIALSVLSSVPIWLAAPRNVRVVAGQIKRLHRC